jgi:hypothetical protein
MSVSEAAEAEFRSVMKFLYDIGYELEDDIQLPVPLDSAEMRDLAKDYADAQTIVSSQEDES